MNASQALAVKVVENCALCGGALVMVATQVPGYQKPSRYDVLRCTTCDTSCACPLEVDSRIYDRIYEQIDRIPGYERYARYAREVLKRRDPLSYLADQEDVYWSVQSHLRSLTIPAKELRLIEIGSGLGYLTYALSRRGYSVTGIDISQEAVQASTARYGEHYRCVDIAGFSEKEAGRADVVIMTELIEHVVDPLDLLQKCKKLLRPGGTIVLTTPNRTIYPTSSVWLSELPPVHLWWFTENAILRLADRLNMMVAFTDFSEYSLKFGFVKPGDPGKTPDPVLDSHGGVCYRSSVAIALLRRLRLYDSAVRLYPRLISWAKRSRRDVTMKGRRATLCAVLSLS